MAISLFLVNYEKAFDSIQNEKRVLTKNSKKFTENIYENNTSIIQLHKDKDKINIVRGWGCDKMK